MLSLWIYISLYLIATTNGSCSIACLFCSLVRWQWLLIVFFGHVLMFCSNESQRSMPLMLVHLCSTMRKSVKLFKLILFVCPGMCVSTWMRPLQFEVFFLNSTEQTSSVSTIINWQYSLYNNNTRTTTLFFIMNAMWLF